ncbi:MAG: thioesterase family protein [bacterium]|nr:thioesterase family protein [bacterium]
MHENRTVYRVPYADVDQMGVVYYARYLEYFERGRNELLRQCNLPYLELERAGVMLPVIEAHCEYLKPARYDDEVVIIARVTAVQGIRIQMTCEIMRGETLLARGYTWHVSTSVQGKPCRLPAAVTALFKEPAA